MMRSIRRRAERKRNLRALLVKTGLLPEKPDDFDRLVQHNRWPIPDTPTANDKDRTVWHLRVEALERELHPYEFGRVLVHLNQRRGALGVETDEEATDEGKIKDAIDRLKSRLDGKTIGQFMLAEMQERRTPITGKKANYAQGPIRNRRDSYEFHADRTMVRDEFNRTWAKQAGFDGELASLLTDSLKQNLDNPDSEDIWREQGAIFGQRKTYWDTGTLGRCDLEPTDRCCPELDMYAQHYRVIETVNNIRVEKRGTSKRGLTPDQRHSVIDTLRKQQRVKSNKEGKYAAIRKALKIDKSSLKKTGETEDFYSLNIERDEQREINTDRFWREIVLGVFGEEAWAAMTPRERDSVNTAILRFDKDAGGHEQRLRDGCRDWWGLDGEQSEALIKSWKARGRTEDRMSMSRRAIRNVLPYMDRFDKAAKRWPTQIEAKQAFTLDPDATDQTTGKPATRKQRVRYAHDIHCDKLRHLLLTQLDGDEGEYERLLKLRGSTKASRHFEAKHPDLLPPAPMMSNPVVRKAIHEVRRHVMAHIAAAGCTPDRVVIELAREARQSGKVRDATLRRNRDRNAILKKIESDYNLAGRSKNQRRMAQDRVLLCRRQKSVCAYSRTKDGSGVAICERAAAKGETDDGRRLEIDHIVPYSRSGDNGLNNKVLCYVEENRDKGNKTPREWWRESFERRIQPLAFVQGYSPRKSDKEEYFTKKDYARLWDNLTREVKPENEWKNSQLTDTAYAGTQVMEYLRDALFDGVQKSKGGRGVYETNGRYTGMLRRDWELQSEDGKSRDDHRHHAIDAVVIALTEPYQLLPVLAKRAEDAEEYHDRTGYWPKSDPDPTRRLIPKAWKDHLALRNQVMEAREQLLVSHRPVKTKLVGAFHKQTQFGPIPGSDGLFTDRIRVEELKPGHLRLPIPEKKRDAIKRLASVWQQQYQGEGYKPSEAKKKAKERAERIIASPNYKPRLVDPPIGKGGLVRDLDLRKRLRTCIADWRVQQGSQSSDTDFSKQDVETMAKTGKFRHASGVPIRSVIRLRTMKDPVSIALRRWDEQQNKMVPVKKNREKGRIYSSDRIFEGQNNHHIPIREDEKGKWSGNVVTAYDAMRRVRQGHGQAVDRSDDTESGGRFIMSLAEGETIHMCHPDTQEPGFFVVFKLDNPRTIHFKHHTDARLAGGRKEVIEVDGKMKTVEIPDSKREDIAVVVSDLKKKCSLPDGTPPIKVRVSPLGEITEVDERIRPVEVELPDLDPRVVAIARDALTLRDKHPNRKKDPKGKPLPGSWRWMYRQIEDKLSSQDDDGVDIADLAPQLTPALRLLQEIRTG